MLLAEYSVQAIFETSACQPPDKTSKANGFRHSVPGISRSGHIPDRRMVPHGDFTVDSHPKDPSPCLVESCGTKYFLEFGRAMRLLANTRFRSTADKSCRDWPGQTTGAARLKPGRYQILSGARLASPSAYLVSHTANPLHSNIFLVLWNQMSSFPVLVPPILRASPPSLGLGYM